MFRFRTTQRVLRLGGRPYVRLKSTTTTHPLPPPPRPAKGKQRATRLLGAAVLVGGASYVAYETNQPFRHLILASGRCFNITRAAFWCVLDYKRTIGVEYASQEEKNLRYSECHTRSAKRVLKALLANGGIFIKLGQHISSIILLPIEWTSTMRPLQDQCVPTPLEDIEALFLAETGKSTDELFSEFGPEPVGVASLAQVHVARDRETGRKVAVKIQHPHLEEFTNIDIRTTTWLLSVIKQVFPEFEFTWLGEEMEQNLPLELNFIHEASNAQRTIEEFAKLPWTTLYIPEVICATRRTLVMEFIEGSRPDDKEYLARHNIDRNRVSQELTKIFSKFTFLDGWFHGDPHAGNLLIRPKQPHSRSPYNFEIVLLDHGLYFDIPDELRVNYAKLWLTLVAPTTDSVQAERRKYAAFFNIGPDLYPIFESAITGRAALQGAEADLSKEGSFKRASSMLDLTVMSDEEVVALRNAVMNREGLISSLFELLRRIPRRILMILKINDLTRHLDHALSTTHSSVRIFTIMAQYCSLAVWEDDRKKLLEQVRTDGHILRYLWNYAGRWWAFETIYRSLQLAEVVMDMSSQMIQTRDYMRGLVTKGFEGAARARAGLA